MLIPKSVQNTQRWRLYRDKPWKYRHIWQIPVTEFTDTEGTEMLEKEFRVQWLKVFSKDRTQTYTQNKETDPRPRQQSYQNEFTARNLKEKFRNMKKKLRRELSRWKNNQTASLEIKNQSNVYIWQTNSQRYNRWWKTTFSINLDRDKVGTLFFYSIQC